MAYHKTILQQLHDYNTLFPVSADFVRKCRDNFQSSSHSIAMTSESELSFGRQESIFLKK